MHMAAPGGIASQPHLFMVYVPLNQVSWLYVGPMFCRDRDQSGSRFPSLFSCFPSWLAMSEVSCKVLQPDLVFGGFHLLTQMFKDLDDPLKGWFILQHVQ